MNIDITQYSIDELVAHRDNMSLINKVISFDDNSLTSQVYITKNSEFLNENNEVPAWIGIEYMAQTIAAWAGVHAIQKGKAIKPGYLLGTRKYTPYVSSFQLGSILNISIDRSYQSDELGVFDCQISSDQLLAEASLNVYQPQ